MSPRSKTVCEICGESFLTENKLSNHVTERHVHSSTSPSPSVGSSSKRRKLDVGCPLCDYVDLDTDRLQQHVNRMHFDPGSPRRPGTVDFPCPICPLAFDHCDNLETHINEEHRDIVSPQTDSDSQRIPLLENINEGCVICGMNNFDSLRDLDAHIEQHYRGSTPPTQDHLTNHDQLLAKQLEKQERERMKHKEQEDFQKLQAAYGMDNKGNYNQQTMTNLQEAVSSGELTVYDYYEKIYEIKIAESKGLDTGESSTRESVQNDDGEDDPEYNVLSDDDFTNVDKEEFRIDKSVKVTRKEYNDLMNKLNEFTESFLEFNGVEKFETNTDIKDTDNDNDKNTDKPKNDTQSIPAYVCTPNIYLDGKTSTNFSFQNKNAYRTAYVCTPNIYIDGKTSTNFSFQNKNAVKRTNVTISNPVFILNRKSSTNCCTNNNAEPIEVAKYNIQIDKQFNISEFNNSILSINKPLEKRSYIHPPLPTFKENVQLGIEQHNNSNEDVSVITNIVPQYVNIMTQKQIILFKLQLTQHVQLITQNYLLCTLSKNFNINCRKYKSMLERIKDICKDKEYGPINTHSALKFIRDWTELKTDENDINSDYVQLPLHVKEFMLYYDKSVFIYPQLLPTRTYHHEYKSHPIGSSEERLLVLKIDYIYKNLTEHRDTRAKYRKMNLSDLMPIIIKTVHKRWFSNRSLTYLKQYITRRNNSFGMNVIKNYLTNGIIEESSYVIDIKALFKGNRLYECDVRTFPSSWKDVFAAGSG